MDGDGQITGRTLVVPKISEIIGALPQFRGKLVQVPPLYSAKSIDGERAYAMARRGEMPELKGVNVTVYTMELLKQMQENTYQFRICCSAGTYIRSLCRDLAQQLNSLACMIAIHRSRAGDFTDQTAVTLEQLAELGETALIPVECALGRLPRLELADDLYEKVLNGIKIDIAPFNEPFTVYGRNELLGIGRENSFKGLIHKGKVMVVCNFRRPFIHD